MSFEICFPVILSNEGGYTFDQGGPTNLGVTQRALSAYLGRQATIDEVKALTPATVAPLYEQNFYNAAHCNQLPAGVDLMVFDESANEGPGTAVRHLQGAVGVISDGAFGPLTLSAVQVAAPRELIQHLHDTNAAFYRSIGGTYPQDLAGWLTRNDRTLKTALAMAQ